jgi:hypothetical protein
MRHECVTGRAQYPGQGAMSGDALSMFTTNATASSRRWTRAANSRDRDIVKVGMMRRRTAEIEMDVNFGCDERF